MESPGALVRKDSSEADWGGPSLRVCHAASPGWDYTLNWTDT